MPDFRIEGETVSFWARVKPNSRQERLRLAQSGEFSLEVSAPPIEGRANEACIRFLARSLHLPQACVVILSGHHARRKLFRVTGHSAQETIERLETLAGARRKSEGKVHKARAKRQE